MVLRARIEGKSVVKTDATAKRDMLLHYQYLELFFNRGCEGATEWGLGLDFGYSKNYILIGHNFFGDTPEIAVDRATKHLSQFVNKE